MLDIGAIVSHRIPLNNNRAKIFAAMALVILQASYLFTYFESEIAPFPPTYYDQAGYLLDSYTLSWRAQTDGLVTLAAAPFRGVSPQGALFAPEGGALDLFGGGGRLSQLLLNFMAFLLAELALYFCVTFLTNRTGLGLAAVGLFLTQRSMWNAAGGIFDFRIDFLALCLYGAALGAALRSRVFLSKRWTLVTALILSVLILNRYIMAAYTIGVLSIVIITQIIPRQNALSKLRTTNAILCLACVAVIVAPFIIESRNAIYGYYVVGHMTGPEKSIRAAQFGVVSWMDQLDYYFVSVARDHLAAIYGIACLCLLICMALAFIRRPVRNGDAALSNDVVAEASLVVTSVLVPLVVLTLDASKSPVVGGIVCIPLVLLVTLLPRWLNLTGHGERSRIFWLSAGSIILALGTLTQLNNAARERLTSARDDSQRWAQGVTWIFNDARERRMRSPHIFFDTVSDRLNADVISTFGYEQSRFLIPFDQTLGDSILAFDPAKALGSLSKSDYVVLTSGSKVGVYPFFSSMARVEPQVRQWTQQHLILRNSFELDGEEVQIYSRPVIDLHGVSGEWISAQGVFLDLVPAEIKRGQIVMLRGPDGYRRYLPKLPSVSAVATVDGHGPIAIRTSFHRSGKEYEIDLNTSPLSFFGRQSVDVALSFNRFFVPKEEGMNADTRHLVVLAPTDVEVRPSQGTDFDQKVIVPSKRAEKRGTARPRRDR